MKDRTIFRHAGLYKAKNIILAIDNLLFTRHSFNNMPSHCCSAVTWYSEFHLAT